MFESVKGFLALNLLAFLQLFKQHDETRALFLLHRLHSAVFKYVLF